MKKYDKQLEMGLLSIRDRVGSRTRLTTNLSKSGTGRYFSYVRCRIRIIPIQGQKIPLIDQEQFTGTI